MSKKRGSPGPLSRDGSGSETRGSETGGWPGPGRAYPLSVRMQVVQAVMQHRLSMAQVKRQAVVEVKKV